MAGEERRSQVRRADDAGVNGWKEKQELVLKTLKDLEKGQTALSAEVRQSREAIQRVHSTPCPAVEKVNTKMDTGMRVIRWFVTPLFIALAGGAIALLFKVFSSGGVQ